MKKMTEAQLAELETDLNAIREEVLAELGERDARYNAAYNNLTLPTSETG